MKNQIATTIEQSRRLLACGVDPKTADISVRTIKEPYGEDMAWLIPKLLTLPYDEARTIYGEDEITPAWSLSALCSLIPSKVTAPHANTLCYFRLYHKPDKWMAMYHDGKESGDAEDYYWQYASQQDGEDPIEVCVAIIEWLLKKNISLNKTEE